MEFKECVNGNPMNYDERMKHYINLWQENHAHIVEDYLRQIQYVTRMMSNLSKPRENWDAIKKALPEQMEILRTHCEIYERSLQFMDRYQDFAVKRLI